MDGLPELPQNPCWEFRLRIWVVKAVLQGQARAPPIVLPQPGCVVATKQFQYPGATRK